MTAGYPAEYGRKLGGVIEVTTERDSRHGFHGKAEVSGGSFATFGLFCKANMDGAITRCRVSASGDQTDRYLDPPVEENFTNHGTASSFTTHYESDLNDTNRIGFIVRHRGIAFSGAQ